jgi:GNAT superfamily N-acetyltransferase
MAKKLTSKLRFRTRKHLEEDLNHGIFFLGRSNVEFEYTDDWSVVWILSLGVVKEFRRQGFATQLLTEIFKRMPENGYFNPGWFACSRPLKCGLVRVITRLSHKYKVKIHW